MVVGRRVGGVVGWSWRRIHAPCGVCRSGRRCVRARWCGARCRAVRGLVGRLRVAVVQLGADHRERALRREDREVGVGARRDPPFWGAGRASPARRPSAHHVAERDAAPPRLRPHDGQGDLQRGDSAHEVERSPVSLRSQLEGEWSLAIRLRVPACSAAQRASWWARSRIGGKHFTAGLPSGSSSAQSAR